MPRSIEGAVEHFTRAAALGNAHAHRALGRLREAAEAIGEAVGERRRARVCACGRGCGLANETISCPPARPPPSIPLICDNTPAPAATGWYESAAALGNVDVRRSPLLVVTNTQDTHARTHAP